MRKLYLGVDIGGTKIAYGIFDESGSLTVRREYPSDVQAGPDALFAPMLNGLREEGADFSCVCGVGIGAPSAIDYKNTRIVSTVNLPLLADIPIREFFTTLFPNADIRAETQPLSPNIDAAPAETSAIWCTFPSPQASAAE